MPLRVLEIDHVPERRRRLDRFAGVPVRAPPPTPSGAEHAFVGGEQLLDRAGPGQLSFDPPAARGAHALAQPLVVEQLLDAVRKGVLVVRAGIERGVAGRVAGLG